MVYRLVPIKKTHKMRQMELALSFKQSGAKSLSRLLRGSGLHDIEPVIEVSQTSDISDMLNYIKRDVMFQDGIEKRQEPKSHKKMKKSKKTKSEKRNRNREQYVRTSKLTFASDTPLVYNEKSNTMIRFDGLGKFKRISSKSLTRFKKSFPDTHKYFKVFIPYGKSKYALINMESYLKLLEILYVELEVESVPLYKEQGVLVPSKFTLSTIEELLTFLDNYDNHTKPFEVLYNRPISVVFTVVGEKKKDYSLSKFLTKYHLANLSSSQIQYNEERRV